MKRFFLLIIAKCLRIGGRIMAGYISHVVRMFLFGISNFRLHKKRTHRRYTLNRNFLTPAQRWFNIGLRLRQATLKVVERNE